jgi:hypothetical protein
MSLFLINGTTVESRDSMKKMNRLFIAGMVLVASICTFLQLNVLTAKATTVSWTSSQSVPAGNWYAVAYGNGRWTAVAQSGTNRLMTSTDGASWTTSGLTYNGSAGGPVDGDWRAVLYANNMWLAAGYDGRMMTSSDGLAWSNAGVTGLTVNEDINSVAYKTGTWVAVGNAASIATSSDGLTWTTSGISGAPAGIALRSVLWSSSRGRFIAVGDSSTVIYSTDGLTWSNASVSGITAGLSLTSIAGGIASNGNLRFVIVSPSNTSGSVWSSTDGLSWTAGTANSSCTSSQRWNAVAYGNGRWIAGRGAGGTCDSISSILGIQTSWEQPSGGAVSWWNAIAYGNSRWVAVGSGIAMSSPEPFLTPTFDTPVATADGFTVNVTNYSASYFWASAPTVSAGTATWGTASGSTRSLTVTGLSGGSSATVTVTATRSGFAPGSASVSGTALTPAQSLSPSTQTVSGTSGTAISPSTAFTPTGFTGAVTYTVTSGSLPSGLQINQATGVVSGTPSTASSANVTVTGSSGAESATATITFTINSPSPVPTFGSVTSTADGFTVNVTNYDPAFTWTPSVNTGSVVAGTPSGSILPLTVSGLSVGASATVTVATSRTGYANSSASLNGAASSATTTTSTTSTTTTTVPSAVSVITDPNSSSEVPRPTPVAAPSAGQTPALITSRDTGIAGRQPGQVAAIVDGQSVAASVDRITTPAISVSPTNRTAEQVIAVQQAAASLVADFKISLPQNATAPISLTNTTTGAVINGLLLNPRNTSTAIAVPVENVVVMTVGSTRLMLVSATPDGKPLDLASGTLRVGPGGILSIAMVGLAVNAPGEAVLFSEPTLLGSFTTSSSGTFSGQFTVPSQMNDGSHTLLVKVGASTVSIGVQLDESLSMPSTGVNINSLLILAMLLMFAGLFSILVSRHVEDRA